MNDKKTPYNSSSIKAVSPVEHILDNPSMYWGKDMPLSEDVVDAIVEQLRLMGCKDIVTFKDKEWYFVGASNDWMAKGILSVGSLKLLIDKGCEFLEGGALSLRCEPFVKIFSKDLLVWRGAQLNVMKGHCDDRIRIAKLLENRFGPGVAIGFRGNSYATHDRSRK